MRPIAALVALSLVLSSAPAFAQDAYKAGVKLENSGDLVGALASFESIPVEKRDFNARLHIAGCKKKLGRLLEAERDYESIRTDPKADPATVETAASDLDDLRPRIPKLVVKLSAATKDVKVAIDGHEAKVPTTVTVNPGTHSVIATRGDAQVFKRDVTMSESTTIEVEIDAPASAPVVTYSPKSTTTPSDAPASGGSSQKTWGWIGVGAGAVFLVGAGGGWLYSGTLAETYKKDCTGTTSTSCDEKRDSVRTWETLSVVSVAVGVIGVGVGVTLLLTAPKEKTIALRATPNALLLVGEF